jgi:BlaI family penicillinase repressor
LKRGKSMTQVNISEAEWKVMKVIWREGDIILSELVSSLTESEWSYSTIKTLLKRLVDKGFVEVDKTLGNNFRYKAAIQEDECKITQTENFLDRVFGGSISMLVAALTKDNKISDNEREEIISIIKNIKD